MQALSERRKRLLGLASEKASEGPPNPSGISERRRRLLGLTTPVKPQAEGVETFTQDELLKETARKRRPTIRQGIPQPNILWTGLAPTSPQAAKKRDITLPSPTTSQQALSATLQNYSSRRVLAEPHFGETSYLADMTKTVLGPAVSETVGMAKVAGDILSSGVRDLMNVPAEYARTLRQMEAAEREKPGFNDAVPFAAAASVGETIDTGIRAVETAGKATAQFAGVSVRGALGALQLPQQATFYALNSLIDTAGRLIDPAVRDLPRPTFEDAGGGLYTLTGKTKAQWLATIESETDPQRKAALHVRYRHWELAGFGAELIGDPLNYLSFGGAGAVSTAVSSAELGKQVIKLTGKGAAAKIRNIGKNMASSETAALKAERTFETFQAGRYHPDVTERRIAEDLASGYSQKFADWLLDIKAQATAKGGAYLDAAGAERVVTREEQRTAKALYDRMAAHGQVNVTVPTGVNLKRVPEELQPFFKSHTWQVDLSRPFMEAAVALKLFDPVRREFHPALARVGEGINAARAQLDTRFTWRGQVDAEIQERFKRMKGTVAYLSKPAKARVIELTRSMNLAPVEAETIATMLEGKVLSADTEIQRVLDLVKSDPLVAQEFADSEKTRLLVDNYLTKPESKGGLGLTEGQAFVVANAVRNGTNPNDERLLAVARTAKGVYDDLYQFERAVGLSTSQVSGIGYIHRITPEPSLAKLMRETAFKEKHGRTATRGELEPIQPVFERGAGFLSEKSYQKKRQIRRFVDADGISHYGTPRELGAKRVVLSQLIDSLTHHQQLEIASLERRLNGTDKTEGLLAKQARLKAEAGGRGLKEVSEEIAETRTRLLAANKNQAQLSKVSELRDRWEADAGKGFHVLDALEDADRQVTMLEKRLSEAATKAGAPGELRTTLKAQLDAATDERTRLRKALEAEEKAGRATRKLDTSREKAIEILEAVFDELPGDVERLYVHRGRMIRNSIPPVGDTARVSKSGDKITVMDFLVADGSGGVVDMDFVQDLEKVDKNNLLIVGRHVDGRVEALPLSAVRPEKSMAHLQFYSEQAAYMDEILSEMGPIYDPNMLRQIVDRIDESAENVAAKEFFDSLKRDGYAFSAKANPDALKYERVTAEMGLKGLEGYFVEKRNIEWMQKAFHPNTASPNAVYRAIQGYNRVFKTWVTSIYPAFNMQNHLSNTWLNFLNIGEDSVNLAVRGQAAMLQKMNTRADELERLAAGGAQRRLPRIKQEAVRAASVLSVSNIASSVGRTMGRAIRETYRNDLDAQTARGLLLELRNTPVFKDVSGRQITFGEIQDTVRRENIAFTGLNTGFLDLDVPTQATVKAARYGPPSPLRTGAEAARKVATAPEKAGRFTATTIEDFARLTSVIGNLKRTGGDWQAAVNRTREFLFDYGDLTPLERKHLRTFIPFWTFSKKNFALQAKMAFQKPGTVSFQEHALDWAQYATGQEPMTEEERLRFSEWTQEGVGVIVKRGDDGSFLTLDNATMPIQQALNTIHNGVFGVASSVTPILRAPIEAVTGFQMFTARKMGATSDVTDLVNFFESNPLMEKGLKKSFYQAMAIAPANPDGRPITTSGDFVIGDDFFPKGGRIVAQNPKVAHLIRNLPVFQRMMSESRKWQSLNLEPTARTLEVLTGVNFSKVTAADLQRIADFAFKDWAAEEKKRNRTEQAFQSLVPVRPPAKAMDSSGNLVPTQEAPSERFGR